MRRLAELASQAATALAIAERLKRRQVELLDPTAGITFTRLSTVAESTVPGPYTSTLSATSTIADIVTAFGALAQRTNDNTGLINNYLYVFQANQLAT